MCFARIAESFSVTPSLQSFKTYYNNISLGLSREALSSLQPMGCFFIAKRR